MNQFNWNEEVEMKDLIKYANEVGSANFNFHNFYILELTIEDAVTIVNLHRREYSNIIIPELSMKEIESLNITEKILYDKINQFLSEKIKKENNTNGFFMKTNRHSCKDSPIDYPNSSDIQNFIDQIKKTEIPTMDKTIDNIDFSIAFNSMCMSRLKSIKVTNADDAMSLLKRSKRIFNGMKMSIENKDLNIYLAFCNYNDDIVQYSSNEFRCVISKGQLRCIFQYSYMIKLNLFDDNDELINDMINEIRRKIEKEIINFPDYLKDVLIDVQVVPISNSNGSQSFNINLLEYNPLGPGGIWGDLYWDRDKDWLLGNKPIPDSVSYSDNLNRRISKIKILYDNNNEKNVIYFIYTTKSTVGFDFEGLYCMNQEYMLELWKYWKMEERK